MWYRGLRPAGRAPHEAEHHPQQSCGENPGGFALTPEHRLGKYESYPVTQCGEGRACASAAPRPLHGCTEMIANYALQVREMADVCMQRIMPVIDATQDCASISPGGSNFLTTFMKKHRFAKASHNHEASIGSLLATWRNSENAKPRSNETASPLCVMMPLREPARRFESGFRNIFPDPSFGNECADEKGFRCAWNRRQREINPLVKVTTMNFFVDAAINATHPMHALAAIHRDLCGTPVDLLSGDRRCRSEIFHTQHLSQNSEIFN